MVRFTAVNMVMNMMTVDDNGVNLVASFEKFRPDSYKDAVGVWTIGYGTTELNGLPVEAGMFINEKVAHILLKGKCIQLANLVRINILIQLNQNQLNSLTSLSYNIGWRAFLQSSLMLAINHKLLITEDLFTRFNKGRVNGILTELPGLTTRRKEEYSLFIKKD